MEKVRKRLGVTRSSLGSLSESVAIFDPKPLTRIAAELAHKLPAVRQGKSDVVRRQLTAVDGSVVTKIQVYCAIIACLLIMLYTGRRPSIAIFETVCFYLLGWASLEDVEYLDVLEDPGKVAQRLAVFLGEEFDAEQAAAVVDPSLRHERA